MKKVLNLSLIFALVAFMAITGCKEDEPEPPQGQESYTVLKSHMESNNMDLPDLLAGWVIAATPMSEDGIVDVDNGCAIPDYYVFDIRTADAFNAGHIKDAINVPLAEVVEKAANYTDKPILVACFTGQTAGHAVMALRLSGYSDAKVLKWGMAGWNAEFEGPWAGNAGHENGNVAVGNANWVTTDAPAIENHDNPSWTTTATDGAEILAERVDAMLNDGFKNVKGDDVLANPANYQIINFWPNEDYTSFGHFEGAYQLKPISLEGDLVKAFDPAQESLVYCYTGQTSSMVTAWLNVLGYNAKSILFGVNHLNYDGLYDAGKPNWHGPADYEYVTE